MRDPLAKVKALIRKFNSQIEEIRQILQKMRVFPVHGETKAEFEENLQQIIQKEKIHFEPGYEKIWQISPERCWLYGATRGREMMDLEGRKRRPLKKIDIAKSDASYWVKNWSEKQDEKDTYYELCEKLEKPHKRESFEDYIKRMFKLIEEGGKGEKLRWRAFKSFLCFLRTNQGKKVAFIENLFPRKMGFCENKIIKKLQQKDHPLPERVAVEIVMELAHIVLLGRPNACLCAAESLGLALLCFAASRLRSPIGFTELYNIKATSLHVDGANRPFLMVPTCFGLRKVLLSRFVFRFLMALARIPSKNHKKGFFQSPFRSLTRCLQRTLKIVDPSSTYGNITYFSMLSPPTLCERRYHIVKH